MFKANIVSFSYVYNKITLAYTYKTGGSCTLQARYNLRDISLASWESILIVTILNIYSNGNNTLYLSPKNIAQVLFIIVICHWPPYLSTFITVCSKFV